MKKILVIEDNKDIRENAAEILELGNYKVFTAENGKIGVETALLTIPDLIICDIGMPVLDGYGVLHLLQKNIETRNIPFVFLTARTERAEMRKAMDLGADDYITKPFEETDLLHSVESRLKKMDLMINDLSPGVQAGNGHNGARDEKDNLQFLAENRNINKYKKKQTIYSEGNRPSRLFFVQKGKVKTYKTNEDGKELVVGLYNAGEYFGHVALLEGTGYKEMAEALEDTELAIIPKEDFDEIMGTCPAIARRFISLMAGSITSNENHLLGLAYNSLRKKVAEALVMLHDKYKGPLNISRENLAAIAGTATESMIRTLSDFKNEKLIEIKEGSIILLNRRKLETMPG